MKAVVLVGGEGTRLRPLTYETPKPLLPIANEPFLERQLRWLARHGVDEVVLSMGYLPDAFASHFPGGRFGDVKLRYAVEADPLGTAGGIRFAAEGVDERFLVCNGDILTTLDLSALLEFHIDCGAEATIALTEVEDPSAFGVVPTRDDGEVIAFVEKPPKDRAPTNWINAGTYVLEPSVLARIPPRLSVSIERETFPRMLVEPRRLYAMRSDAYWLDIGTPEKYLQAQGDVLRGALGLPPVPNAREKAPGIWMQGSAAIDPTATVIAPLLIGDGVVVEAGARIEGSVFGARCTVEAGARVVRSVLHNGARLAADAEAIDTVVGADALVDTGAIASDHTMVGPHALVPAGARASGARFREEG
ncbi:MAG: NDP-sugar synthase [Acidimicrobiia bacterium]